MGLINENGIVRDETPQEEADRLALFNTPPTAMSYQMAIQALVDRTAQSKQFNDGVTLASYVNSTITAWSAQAEAFVAWRDQVWSYAYTELAKVEAGQRTQPTVEAFLAELPAISWPA